MKIIAIEEQSDIFCDGCGREIEKCGQDEISFEGNFNFGYSSKDKDGIKIKIELCQYCSDKLLKEMIEKYESIKDLYEEADKNRQ